MSANGSARGSRPGQGPLQPDGSCARLRWLGRTPGYLSSLTITMPTRFENASAPPWLRPGWISSALISLPKIEWVPPDWTIERAPGGSLDDPDGPPLRAPSRSIAARHPRFGRVVIPRRGIAGRYRIYDPGDTPVTLLQEDFAGGSSASKWTSLRIPHLIVVAGAEGAVGPALLLHSQRTWESGILRHQFFFLRAGLEVSARIGAP